MECGRKKEPGDARSKMRPKIYILIDCSSQRMLDFHGGKSESDENTAKLRHDATACKTLNLFKNVVEKLRTSALLLLTR